MPGVVLGYVLAGNPLFDVRALAWALFGLLFHAFGFLQNNLFDYELDKKDPSKAHHPMITGEIKYLDAARLDVVLAVGMILYLLALTWGNWYSQLLFLPCFILATVYNLLCKKSLLGPLYITVSFTILVFVPFVNYTRTVTPLMWLLGALTAFLMLFQISVSGYLKDMKQTDEVNLLRAMGSKLEGENLKLSLQAVAYAEALAWIKAFILLAMIVVAGTATWAYLGALAVSMGFIWLSVKLVSPGPFEHDRRVKQMAIVEVLSYFSLVFALEGVIGWMGVAALIVLPMLWFVALNRVMWQTAVTPRV